MYTVGIASVSLLAMFHFRVDIIRFSWKARTLENAIDHEDSKVKGMTGGSHVPEFQLRP